MRPTHIAYAIITILAIAALTSRLVGISLGGDASNYVVIFSVFILVLAAGLLFYVSRREPSATARRSDRASSWVNFSSLTQGKQLRIAALALFVGGLLIGEGMLAYALYACAAVVFALDVATEVRSRAPDQE